MKSFFIIFIVSLISSSAFGLECTGIVITDSEQLEKTFNVPMVSQGHGGQEIAIIGKTNKVLFMADGKWLGIHWEQNGELIAESVNLIRQSVNQPRVLINYNPKNTDEQVSVDCHN